jgi:hypothetical protein
MMKLEGTTPSFEYVNEESVLTKQQRKAAVTIKFDTQVMHHYIDTLYSTMELHWSIVPKAMPFTCDIFKRYLETWLYNWIEYKLRRKVLVRPQLKINLPDWFHLTCLQLGNTFEPKARCLIEIVSLAPSGPLLGADSMLAVSRQLEMFEKYGFSFTKSSVSYVDGNFDLLSLEVDSDSQIVSPSKDVHPGLTMMAAMLEPDGFSNLIGKRSYLYEFLRLDEYRLRVQRLVQPGQTSILINDELAKLLE